MGVFGTILGGAAGFLVGGPAGAAIGAGIGGAIGGSPDAPQAPGIGDFGEAIQAEQLAQLQSSGVLLEELKPFQLAQLGLTRDEDGNVRQMTEDERFAGLTPEERLVEKNRLLTEGRFGSALAGEGPSPALARDLARLRKTSIEGAERAGKSFGSTARAQLEGRLNEAEAIALDTERRGDINTFATLGENLRSGASNRLTQRLAALRGQPLGSVPLIQAGASALQPSLQAQQLGFQGQLAQQQASSQQLGGFGQLAGIGLGLL